MPGSEPVTAPFSKVGTPFTKVRRIGAGLRVQRHVWPPLPSGHVIDFFHLPVLDFIHVEHGNIGAFADFDFASVGEAEMRGEFAGLDVHSLIDCQPPGVTHPVGEQLEVFAAAAEHLPMGTRIACIADGMRIPE